MNPSLKISKLTYFAAVSAVAVLVAANVGIVWADHHPHGSDQGDEQRACARAWL
jgi:hypothetical protein